MCNHSFTHLRRDKSRRKTHHVIVKRSTTCYCLFSLSVCTFDRKMNISGIREPEIFKSDSESTDVENKLSHLPTESSSESNEDCINDSQSSEQAIIEQNQLVIQEYEGHLVPTEHTEIENCNCPPEDNSMESVGPEETTKLCNIETTDDDSENERSPRKLRKRKRPSSLVETEDCKTSVDEPCPKSSQSSSESGNENCSSQSSQYSSSLESQE